jgi:hypothetical protein
MNQKEIKANMTQGTWESNLDAIVDINKGSINLWGIDRVGRHHNTTPNALAIVSAINNTYGKNINPESVPDMFNALQSLKAYFVDGENYDEICNILKNATL